jgi:hypothetical protein
MALMKSGRSMEVKRLHQSMKLSIYRTSSQQDAI